MSSNLPALAFAAMLAGAASAQPFEHRASNGVTWLSGGVSIDERDAMRGLAGAYSLEVVLAMDRSGEYRAEVPVSIEDASGNPVLSIVTDGPWLFAKVPPGRYRIRTGDGQERTADVGGGAPSIVYFHALSE